MAPGAVSVVGVLVCTLVAKYTNRTLAGIFASILSIIGTIMMFAIPASNYNSRYGGYVLALLCKLGFSAVCNTSDHGALISH
jgi:ACS family allantoate permease-like MFS transporter